MAFKVEVMCPKCEKEFEVKSDCLPLEDEGGHQKEAVCPNCRFNCGDVSVTLEIT